MEKIFKTTIAGREFTVKTGLIGQFANVGLLR